jgi:hypothetical protein
MEQLYLNRIKAFALDFLICFFSFFIVNMVIDHILFTNRIFYNGQHWLLNFTNLKPVAFMMLFRDFYKNKSIGKDLYNLKVVSLNIGINRLLLALRQITILISFYIDLVIYFLTRKRLMDMLLKTDVVYDNATGHTSYKRSIYKCLMLILIAILINASIFFYVKYEKINVFSYNKDRSDKIYEVLKKNTDLLNSVKVNVYDKMYGTGKGYIEINLFTVKSYWKKENQEILNNDFERIKNSLAEVTDTSLSNIELRLIKDYKTRVEINNFYINYDERLKPNTSKSWFEFIQ